MKQGGAGMSAVGRLRTGLLNVPATPGIPSDVPSGLQKPSRSHLGLTVMPCTSNAQVFLPSPS